MIHVFYSLKNLFKLQKNGIYELFLLYKLHTMTLIQWLKTLQTTLKLNFVILASPTLVLYIVIHT